MNLKNNINIFRELVFQATGIKIENNQELKMIFDGLPKGLKTLSTQYHWDHSTFAEPAIEFLKFQHYDLYAKDN